MANRDITGHLLGTVRCGQKATHFYFAERPIARCDEHVVTNIREILKGEYIAAQIMES